MKTTEDLIRLLGLTPGVTPPIVEGAAQIMAGLENITRALGAIDAEKMTPEESRLVSSFLSDVVMPMTAAMALAVPELLKIANRFSINKEN